MSGQLLYSLEDAAEQLGGISTRTVRRLIDRGQLSTCKVGRRLMVVAESVRNYVDGNMQPAHNQPCAGKVVQEESTCQESVNAIRTGYSPARTRHIGGRASRMNAANQLAEALALDVKKIHNN
ncbi:helix-turn-helix domain-containing protein [Thiolapillus brandeum]